MIIYDLICVCGYQFEGWFEDRFDYDRQIEEGVLFCPQCDGTTIHKILSPVASLKTPVSSLGNSSVKAYDPNTIPTEKEIKEFINTMATYVKKNYKDVGTNLAEKALKMHYGVEQEEKIRGVATLDEEKMLEKEGINLVKIPLPLDEKDGEN